MCVYVHHKFKGRVVTMHALLEGHPVMAREPRRPLGLGTYK